MEILVFWLLFGLLHSGLASTRVKAGLGRSLSPKTYRRVYNLIAVLTLLPGLLLLQHHPGEVLLTLPFALRWSLMAIGVAIFWMASRQYDLGAFLGSRSDTGHFDVKGLHRFVRHPWYLAGLLILWAQSMTVAMLETQCAVTLYILIGIYFEEKKLSAALGAPYRQYQAAVPALLPSPFRYLTAEAARTLALALSRAHATPDMG